MKIEKVNWSNESKSIEWIQFGMNQIGIQMNQNESNLTWNELISLIWLTEAESRHGNAGGGHVEYFPFNDQHVGGRPRDSEIIDVAGVAV